MEGQEHRSKWFLAAGLMLLGFGLLWFVGGGEFLDRPDTTMMMGMPFLVAGVVVTVMALALGRY